MVAHQAPGMHDRSIPHDCRFHIGEKLLPIFLALEDVLLFIASRCDMVECAGTSAPFGLSKDEALKAVTIYPAQILGVDKLIGSIEVGKMANLIVTDGDPLEFKTSVKHMFINGKPVDLSSRHTRLYEKFNSRP